MPREATVLRDGTPDDAGGIARGRGGFLRGANDVAYISDPTGVLVKSGARKGEVKRLAYGSPSAAGKLIENTFNLQKWGERRAMLGMGRAVELGLDLVDEVRKLVALDVESDEFKVAADAVVVAARDLAEANMAADRGSHAHGLSEDADNQRDWISRAAAGEVLGLDLAVQQSLVDVWNEMLEREGLEILAVEASCVHDGYRLAGTLDRIARLTRPLRFAMPGGEIVVIPAGTVLVLDIKSGKLELDRDGHPKWWHGYVIQIEAYATSLPYDTETELRGEWPWPISPDHGLVAHLDVLGAIEGRPSCRLIYVDLRTSREHGMATVLAAKEWGKRRDLFSVAQLPEIPTDDLCVSVPVQVSPGGAAAAADEAAGDRTPIAPAADLAAPSPPDVEQPAEEAPPATASAEIAHTHEWKQVGRCVYCDGCGMRYQGKAPSTPDEAAAISAVLDSHVLAADVRPAPGAAAPGAMTDDEARAAYAALDDDVKREVCRLRDEHIRKEGYAGRVVSKAQATKLALGWVAPFAPRLSRATCSSCGAAIHWAVTDKGHAMPIDPEPRDDGNVHLDADGIAHVITKAEVVDELRPLYVSHFATCPNADRHRKPAPVRFSGDEGPAIAVDEAVAARGWIEALSRSHADDFAAVRQVAKQAHDADVGFNIIAKPTVRRFEIYRALSALGRYGWSDELVRDLLAAATGDDACRQPAVALGQIVGLLDLAQAKDFADLACRLERGSVQPIVGDDDHFTFMDPAGQLVGA